MDEKFPRFQIKIGKESINKNLGAMLVVRVMRLARVARILKLARYSTGLRAFGATMRNSVAELSMLGIFLLTGIFLFILVFSMSHHPGIHKPIFLLNELCVTIFLKYYFVGIMLFSTAIYFFERDEPNSKFYSIPASCWWCKFYPSKTWADNNFRRNHDDYSRVCVLKLYHFIRMSWESFPEMEKGGEFPQASSPSPLQPESSRVRTRKLCGKFLEIFFFEILWFYSDMVT